jgi:hypothetical protein
LTLIQPRVPPGPHQEKEKDARTRTSARFLFLPGETENPAKTPSLFGNEQARALFILSWVAADFSLKSSR